MGWQLGEAAPAGVVVPGVGWGRTRRGPVADGQPGQRRRRGASVLTSVEPKRAHEVQMNSQSRTLGAGQEIRLSPNFSLGLDAVERWEQTGSGHGQDGRQPHALPGGGRAAAGAKVGSGRWQHAYPGCSSVAAQGGRGATVVSDKGQTRGGFRMEQGRAEGGTCRQVCGLERRTDEGRARVTEGEGSGAVLAARDAIQRG